MSFSSEVKEELGKRLDTARHCQIAEFAAIMAFCGKMRSDSGEEMQIEVMTENEVVLRKFILLAESIFEMEEHDFVIEHEGKKNSLIHVYIKEPVYVTKILMTLKWCDEQFTQIEPVFVHPILVQKECCKIVCEYEEDAVQLQELLLYFELDAKVIQRKRNYIVYLKEGNNITDVLNLMGAVVSQMNLYNIMILKGMRNDVNRKVNCETANLNKTIEAAVKQIRDIEYLRDTVGLESLSDGLRQVAYVRLENPDMNLKDIGERLNPTVGKSGVNHRLRKISEMAEQLRGEA